MSSILGPDHHHLRITVNIIMKLWPTSCDGFGSLWAAEAACSDTIDSSSEMWARASEPDTPANDVPTASSHMPATAHNVLSDSNTNNSFNHQDAVPRIYLSSRVADNRTATVGRSPAASTATAKMDIVHQTYRTLTSKTAQRTILNTVLLTTFSSVLYAFAALVYIASYNAYLPDQITTLPIHLQYGYGPNPYGTSSLRNIKDYQAYDVTVSLTLPRTPANIDRDNFMIALYLLDKPGTAIPPPEDVTSTTNTLLEKNPNNPNPPTILSPPNPESHLSTRRILHTSHRPALLPYTDPLLSLFTRLLYLPRAIFFPSGGASSTTISISLAEKLSFPSTSTSSKSAAKSGAVPSSLFLELQAGQSLRVSSASVTFTAQLAGLRWAMHHHRLASFLVGTGLFWGCEVVAMGFAWVVLSAVLFGGSGSGSGSGGGKGGGQISSGERKRLGEGEKEMSDTERTFPTSSRAPPLKYESASGGVKEEDLGAALDMAELPVAKGEAADDEDDELGVSGTGGEGWRDSGIGTSYSDAPGGGGKGVRRRTSGNGR